MNPLKPMFKVAAKNADILMAVGAIFGLGVSVYFAIKKTPVAQDIIFDAGDAIEGIRYEAEEDGWDELAEARAINDVRFDTAKELALCYAPLAVSTITTSALIFGVAKRGRTKVTALTSLLNASNLMYTEYRERTRETIGKNKEQKIYDSIRVDHLQQAPTPSPEAIYNTGQGQTLCYIEYFNGDYKTGLYFWSAPEFVHAGINNMNESIVDQGSGSVADLLYFLKIPWKSSGVNNIGWFEQIEPIEGSHVHPVLKYPTLDISFRRQPEWLHS